MSSSRRSSRSERVTAGRCPTCGSSRVVSVCEELVVQARGRAHRVPDIEHELCRACGERIVGLEANQRLDAAILGGRRRRAS